MSVGGSALTSLGAEQADMPAGRMRETGFDGEIYASPYLRTVQAGAAIAKLFGAKIIPTPEIRERTHKAGRTSGKSRRRSPKRSFC